MNKRELISAIASKLRDNDVKKPVTVKKHKFFISDEDGNRAEFDIKQSTGCLIGGYNKSFRAVIIDASCNIISDVMNTASFPENLDNLSIKTIFNKDCPKLLGRLFGTSFCSSAFNGIGVVFKQLFPGKPHIEIPWIDKIERDDYGIEKKKRYIFNHSLSKY